MESRLEEKLRTGDSRYTALAIALVREGGAKSSAVAIKEEKMVELNI